MLTNTCEFRVPAQNGTNIRFCMFALSQNGVSKHSRECPPQLKSFAKNARLRVHRLIQGSSADAENDSYYNLTEHRNFTYKKASVIIFSTATCATVHIIQKDCTY